MLCTRVCMCACVCVRACEYDEPFSYLISSYSSSRIVLLVIARTARCFRFRCTVTFELSVYLSSLLRVDDAAGGTWRRSSKPKRNERTSKESQEKNESIAFSPLLFFFSYFFLFVFLSYDFSRPGYHFLFRGGAEKTTNNEGQSDSCTVEGFKIEAGHRTVTRPESNSIRSPGIRFATRLLSARNERNPEFRSTRLFSFLSRVPRTRNGPEKRRCAPFL